MEARRAHAHVPLPLLQDPVTRHGCRRIPVHIIIIPRFPVLAEV